MGRIRGGGVDLFGIVDQDRVALDRRHWVACIQRRRIEGLMICFHDFA